MFTFYVLIAYILGHNLSVSLNFPYFFYAAGIVLFFYETGNQVIKLISKKQFLRTEHFALSIVLSLYINSLLLFLLQIRFGLPINQTTVITAITTFNSLLLLLRWLIFYRYKPFTIPPKIKVLPDIVQILQNHWPLFGAISIYIFVHTINFLLYPYIPESDGYGYIHLINKIINTGYNPEISYRPLLPILSAGVQITTGISAIVQFKFLIPLLLGISIIPLYEFARSYKLSKSRLFIAGLLPLGIPILIQEVDITRPQIFIILSSYIVVWLLIKFLCSSRWIYYGIAAFIAFLSYGFHEFSLYLIFTVLITLIPYLYLTLRNNPKGFGLGTVYFLIMLYPYSHGIQAKLNFLVGENLISHLKEGKFRFWFINNYINNDGAVVSWEGVRALLYYAYNIGLIGLLFLLLIIFFTRQKKVNIIFQIYTLPIWALFSVSFLFAEITPRFGATFLPDRSWLYVSISLCFLFVPFLKYLKGKIIYSVLLISIATGIGGAWYITYNRQGWVDKYDIKAATWLKLHTPANSKVIGQSASAPAVMVYAERTYIPNGSFFTSTYNNQLDVINKVSTGAISDEVTDNLAVLNTQINMQWQELQMSSDIPTIEILTNRINKNIIGYAHNKKAGITNRPNPTNHIYVIYSTRKFNGWYVAFPQWNKENAYGADLEKLSKLPLSKVYDEDGVYIWKYNIKY